MGIRLGVEQVKKKPFFSVIGTCGITGRGSDTAILFFDEILVGEIFILAKTPGETGLEMEPFGARLGQAIGESLGQNCVVVIVIFLKFARVTSSTPRPRGQCEGTKVIALARILRRDEIGQRIIRLILGLVHLLAQGVESRED